MSVCVNGQEIKGTEKVKLAFEAQETTSAMYYRLYREGVENMRRIESIYKRFPIRRRLAFKFYARQGD